MGGITVGWKGNQPRSWHGPKAVAEGIVKNKQYIILYSHIVSWLSFAICIAGYDGISYPFTRVITWFWAQFWYTRPGPCSRYSTALLKWVAGHHSSQHYHGYSSPIFDRWNSSFQCFSRWKNSIDRLVDLETFSSFSNIFAGRDGLWICTKPNCLCSICHSSGHLQLRGKLHFEKNGVE